MKNARAREAHAPFAVGPTVHIPPIPNPYALLTGELVLDGRYAATVITNADGIARLNIVSTGAMGAATVDVDLLQISAYSIGEIALNVAAYLAGVGMPPSG